MQMGEIPLLTRAEEIVAAKQIKSARRRFRHIMLATDYVLHAAIDMLKSIRDGQVAAGSHDRSLGDQHSREEAADEGPHAQPRRRWPTSWSRTARILPRRSTSTGP